LLERLQANVSASGLIILTELADELAHPNPEAMLEHGRTLLESLRARDVVLGSE